MNVVTNNANTYDAIVVGSGISGGWAVKELTEKGMQTLVLEAGQTIVPERDYVEHVPVWIVKFQTVSLKRSISRCSVRSETSGTQSSSSTISRILTPRLPISHIYFCADAM